METNRTSSFPADQTPEDPRWRRAGLTLFATFIALSLTVVSLFETNDAATAVLGIIALVLCYATNIQLDRLLRLTEPAGDTASDPPQVT